MACPTRQRLTAPTEKCLSLYLLALQLLHLPWRAGRCEPCLRTSRTRLLKVSYSFHYCVYRCIVTKLCGSTHAYAYVREDQVIGMYMLPSSIYCDVFVMKVGCHYKFGHIDAHLRALFLQGENVDVGTRPRCHPIFLWSRKWSVCRAIYGWVTDQRPAEQCRNVLAPFLHQMFGMTGQSSHGVPSSVALDTRRYSSDVFHFAFNANPRAFSLIFECRMHCRLLNMICNCKL